MTKCYAFNNSTRLNKLIKMYDSYITSYSRSTKMIDFSNYIKSVEYNREGSEFYHINCVYSGILCKSINKLCVPDKTIFKTGMTVWDYIIAFDKKQKQSCTNNMNKNSLESSYLTEAEFKRKSELENIPYIYTLKKDSLLVQNELKNLESQMNICQSKLEAITTRYNNIKEYASLVNKNEDHRPELYRKIRACTKCGELAYHEFEALCEEFGIDNDMVNDYISNTRIKYAFKPYIICKYA